MAFYIQLVCETQNSKCIMNEILLNSSAAKISQNCSQELFGAGDVVLL